MIDQPPIPTEYERVCSWRLERALALNVPLRLAEEFSAGEGDLHKLQDLVACGCAPELAVAIVN